LTIKGDDDDFDEDEMRPKRGELVEETTKEGEEGQSDELKLKERVGGGVGGKEENDDVVEGG
jgi:hypothetical protein